jgi:hypothetical protein
MTAPAQVAVQAQTEKAVPIIKGSAYADGGSAASQMRVICEHLSAPTPTEQIEWKCQRIFQKDDGTYRGLATPYAKARFIMDRLDDVCGSFNWQSEVKEVNGIICVGIGLRVPGSPGQWVWKWDTGMEGEKEETDEGGPGAKDANVYKGIVSNGLKRAGVQWGITRDLYALRQEWRPCKHKEKRGKQVFVAWMTLEECRAEAAAVAARQREAAARK